LTPIVFKVYISYIKSGFFYILILYIWERKRRITRK
jgi:hypothetical protein